MQVDIRHAPSFAVARLNLAAGEAVKAEAGAMAAMSASISIEAKMEGGFMKALKRSALGGESFFVTTYSSPGSEGWVDIAPYLPGDVQTITVTPDRGVAVTKGCWLAHESALDMDTKWGGAKNLFGGEGGFIAHMTGSGVVVVSSYGAMDQHDLAAGEGLVVDSGHVVAYDDGIGLTTSTVSSGVMTTIKSGEGLVMTFTGPGRVWTQTRNPGALVTWLTEVLPFSRS